MTTEPIIPQIPVEPIIARALQGDPDAIERIIDLEVDALGVHRGYSCAAAFWLRVSGSV